MECKCGILLLDILVLRTGQMILECRLPIDQAYFHLASEPRVLREVGSVLKPNSDRSQSETCPVHLVWLDWVFLSTGVLPVRTGTPHPLSGNGESLSAYPDSSTGSFVFFS